jgi:phosphoadenosine phosphosulfate reductase
MYSYEWDIETGGYILNTTPLKFSKEPRPVYSQELDYLGFQNYWTYERDDGRPIMWAEANRYVYRGRVIGQTHGGSLFTPPAVEIAEQYPEGEGIPLRSVDIDAMVVKNSEIMETLVNATIKRVYNTYCDYQKKVDVFHVSFSGGKDSIALLDVVQRALPHDTFIVVFGDTQMEFPDTYQVVDEIEKWCKKEYIQFLRAKSRLEIMDSWKIFGPPSTVLRWCCSVHKTAPQLLALREYLGKDHIRDMAFVGVRADESLVRSEYEYTSLGKKHSSQYSTHPILEWNSAELYLYIYGRKLIMNPAYKKGSNRVGCLICPMSQNKSEHMRYLLYPNETQKFIDSIEISYGLEIGSRAAIQNLEAGGWKQRKSAKVLAETSLNYIERIDNSEFVIEVDDPKTDWEVWITTLGELTKKIDTQFSITAKEGEFPFSVIPNEKGYEVRFPLQITKTNPSFTKILKQVFRKAAMCNLCQECEANCISGCIQMKAGDFKISGCINCRACHDIPTGCLIYDSQKIPTGGGSMAHSKSIDCYASHGPQKEWISEYLNLKDGFAAKNHLGSNMVRYFNRFLLDSGLAVDKKFSPFAEAFSRIGCETGAGLGLLLVNLSYSPQVGWFIKNVDVGQAYSRTDFISLICNFGPSETVAGKMIGSFGRLLNLFSVVGLGNVIKNKSGKIIESFIRGTWENPDPRVILYALYKFAEACDGYYQMSLGRLMDFTVESQGVSPAQIFGLSEATMSTLIRSLSGSHQEFINYSETLGLQTIDLRKDKASADILTLF